jgi:uncharacterized membrane protein YidH (DUF202 family)
MVLVALGLLVWSAINFQRVRRAIDREDYRPSQTLVWILAALPIVLCLASVPLLSL